MDRDFRLYRSIYEYYTTRIQSGYYRKGDALPSLHEISEFFGVSDKTSRRTLRQLREDGFISSGSGRPSIVIKDFTREDHAAYCQTYYQAHKNSMLELHQLRRVFLPSLLLPAFYYLADNCRPQLELYAARVRRRDFRAFIDFFSIVLNSLGNPLLPSLFTESTMFGLLSEQYLAFNSSYSDSYFEKLGQSLEELLSCHASKDFDGIKKEIDRIVCLRADKMMQNLNAHAPAQAQSETAWFQWHIIKGGIQHRSFTAQTLLHRILCGQYLP